MQGEAVTLALNGVFLDTDPGDALTFTVTLADGSPLPSWLTVDAASARLVGTPGARDAGIFRFRLVATDASGASAVDDFELTVLDANLAPILVQAPANIQAFENSELLVVLPAVLFVDDDAGDGFALAAQMEDGSALPHWLTFDAAALTFSGTPRNQDVGETRLRLLAVDRAGAFATATFTIDVHNMNDAPLAVLSIADQASLAGSAFEYVVPDEVFVDLDEGDALSLSATLGDGSPLPSWLSFNVAARRLAGIAPVGGTFEIVVTAWLAGLRDRFVGKALGLLHERPEHPWTVDELGAKVGLARTTLTQRFTDLVGQPPIQDLTRWRLTVAAQRLRTDPASLSRIAGDIGYESQAAFNRAFKREFGIPPAAWRKSGAGASGTVMK